MKYLMKLMSVAFGLSLVSVAANAQEFIDVSGVFGNGETSSGEETHIPRFRLIDSTGDGQVNRLQMWFDVYTRGTTTKLKSTTRKGVAFPSVDCGQQQFYNDADFDPIIGITADGTHAYIALSLVAECEGEGVYEETYQTFLYSSSITTSSNHTWTKFIRSELVGLNYDEVDGEFDLMLMNFGNTRATFKSMTFNDATGEVISSARYPGLTFPEGW